MSLHRANKLVTVLVLVFTASLWDLAHAGTNSNAGIPLPSIATAQGENCVEDTDFMRRNHMELILRFGRGAGLEDDRVKATEQLPAWGALAECYLNVSR